jgi:hypothetical protein
VFIYYIINITKPSYLRLVSQQVVGQHLLWGCQGLLGRGGFCFHCLSSATDPKRKRQWGERREKSSVPSESSKATTRDETWPGEYDVISL